MKILVVLSTLLAASLAFPSLPQSSVGSGRIVGGVNALPGEFPYICSLQWVIITASTHICGASVINNNWLMTAAHCKTESPNIGRFDALCGKLNLAITEPNQARIAIASYINHPLWIEGGEVGPNDIAVLQLAAPLIFNDWIQPVVLPAAGTHPSGPSTIIGWGSTGGTIPTTPDILQKAPVPIIEYSVCRTALEALQAGHIFDDTKVCTGPLTGGISACSGDSGSPVLQGSLHVGVVSWGFMPCGSAGAPSVHTRVSHFIDWINSIVN